MGTLTKNGAPSLSFSEDQSRTRKEKAPQGMAMIRHIALNLLPSQKNSMKRQSIKRLRKMGGWSDAFLSAILSQTFLSGDPDFQRLLLD